jgi:dihydropteroate synthase
MRLRLGSVEHDLSTHTLVLGMLRGDAPLDAVLAQAEQMVGEGADLLDLSPMTASAEMGAEEELARLVPVVAALRSRFDVPLVVGVWRASALSEAVAAGAAACVDVTGFLDEAFLPTAARAGVAVIITHTRRAASQGSEVVGEVRGYLDDQVAQARQAGLAEERIVVDAGLDLGKSPAQSLTLLRESATLADLGPPLLLSISNGRFLGTVLGLDPEERRPASAAAVALGISRGCRIVRASDVRGTKRVADVLEALLACRLVQVTSGAPSGGDAGG